MNILFLGTKTGNSYLQYIALKRNYKNVDFIDGYESLKFKKLGIKIFVHITPKIFETIINKYILSRIKKKYDLIYVKSGELIGKKLITELKRRAKKIVFFCNDNPFVSRDKNRWKLFHSSAKYFDLIAYQDPSRIKPSNNRGIKSFLVLPPYDINIHKRKTNLNKKKNDVVFIGTWSDEKSLFLQKIIRLGLDVKIFGSRWDKDPNFSKLKKNISLGHLKFKKYSNVIRSAKIALCLFEKKNKDTITARSIEIPAIGTLMVSERTKTMKVNFVENKEVIFFNNPNECVKKCNYYLRNDNKSSKIAKRGNLKVTKKLKLTNDNLIKKIINTVFKK